MKKFAVVGSPILHSKSPELFNYFSGPKNKESIYTRICTNSAEEAIAIIKDLEFSGVNITTPLKKTIIPFLDTISSEAEKMNSVNTVIYDNGNYIGHNTDHKGVVGALEFSGIDIKNKNCLVLGAGGAGRAAAFGLLNSGGRVMISNRTLKKAEELSKNLNCEYISINEIDKEIEEIDIIISTIPGDSKILSTIPLKNSQVLLSADYKKDIELHNKLQGPRIINGLLWLIFQGSASFKLFTGNEVEKIDVKKLHKLLKKDHLMGKTSLIGFSGSGKTTIIKNLNTISSIDIDEEIEKETKLSIPDLFKKKGEQYFRNIERPVLRKSILDPEIKIISCGGGILLNKKNRELLAKQTNTVWLRTPLNIVKSRISKGTRPILQTSEDLIRLFSEREDEYLKAADMIIPNTYNENGINSIIDLLNQELLI